MEDDQYLAPLGQPYVPAELQRQFSGMSPRDVYALLCKRRRCRCVSSVSLMLPEKVNSWNEVSIIDLGRTYVGPKGALVVIEICKLFANLKELRLANNYLENASVWALCKMAQFHPSIRRVDVSGNDISWTAGMCLLELTAKNSQLESVVLCDTLLKPTIVNLIDVQTRRNIALQNRNNRRGPNPSNHPITIRLRSLKRFFNDVLAREGVDGKIASSYIVDGVREMWKLTGREDELKQRPPQFFEKLATRAPSSTINWEVFMLLVMGEDIVYHSEYVSKVRFVFNAFDADASGYIEAKDLGEIIMCLSDGRPPPADQVAQKKAFLDLDDTMSVGWDEFLLMVYDLGAIAGTTLNNTATPLSIAQPLTH
eukprot:GILI01026246.1.p1 GENE.GILI01026246.1~~GILI01026246.1.p1  ORF type:complete len:368 (+),score=36.10 GILI01026246.1:23-1126(+)